MSQENVELLHQANDAFNRRAIDAFLALFDPDVEFIPRLLDVEGGGPYHGHDGVQSWWEKLLGVSPDFSSDIDEVRDLGDVTGSRARFRGHGRESDVPIDQTSWPWTAGVGEGENLNPWIRKNLERFGPVPQPEAVHGGRRASRAWSASSL